MRALSGPIFDFSLSSRPVGSVVATLELDGAVAVPEKVVDRRSARRLRSAQAWGATLRLNTGGGSAATVHASTSARILVDNENGRRMSIVRARLPDWPLVDRQMSEAPAAFGIDALDFTSRCRRETRPEADPVAIR